MELLDFKVYLDAGDKDEGEFYNGCSILDKILKSRGIESQNYVFEGHHNVEYIKSNMEKIYDVLWKLKEKSRTHNTL